jgi:hypothetical protein
MRNQPVKKRKRSKPFSFDGSPNPVHRTLTIITGATKMERAENEQGTSKDFTGFGD